MAPPRKHPSGRPLRKDKRVDLSIPRPPRDESLIPGLRRNDSADAIGFHVGQSAGEDEDEDEYADRGAGIVRRASD